MAEEEIEYVSDPEEAKLSLKMRRREASDDEEEEEDDGGEREIHVEKLPLRRMDDSDVESEGAAADYEEDELEEEEGYDLDDEYVEEEEVGYDEGGGGRGGNNVEVVAAERAAAEEGKDGVGAVELTEETKGVNDKENDSGEIGDEDNNIGDKNEEEKKEVEPYSVPTAGAFYMHDDRFRENAGGRHRRMLGGRKLWESKDDKKWGHDKFEQLTVKERYPEERRRGSRGRFRGRGRSRGPDPVYEQGNRSREYNNNNGTQNYNNQNVTKVAPKGGRGRGPRRYQPSYNNDNQGPLTRNKQTGKSSERHSYDNSLTTNEPMSSAEAENPRKQVSSNLSVASPPFYPSSSSSKDNNAIANKRGLTTNRNGQPSAAIENFTKGQPNATMRGKNKVDSVGMNNLYIDGSKSSNALQAPGYGQGRGITSLPQMSYQSAVPNSQVNRVRPSRQMQNVQRNPGQARGQFSGHTSGQQSTRVVSGTQAGAVKAIESAEVESLSDSSKSNFALVAKGKGTMQGSGSGSFMYGGPQVMGASGNMGTGRGDQNFPTFLPVMQFGAQHTGGMGVPAVGMAFPGYVGGRGNSEMTWLPVLAGAAGALGANFCPPYLTVDGSYHTRPSGQVSSAAATSSDGNNATKVSNDWNPTQRPELANDESGQRQKNPRRYTEMKFDQ